jgi:hypothetical protein
MKLVVQPATTIGPKGSGGTKAQIYRKVCQQWQRHFQQTGGVRTNTSKIIDENVQGSFQCRMKTNQRPSPARLVLTNCYQEKLVCATRSTPTKASKGWSLLADRRQLNLGLLQELNS